MQQLKRIILLLIVSAGSIAAQNTLHLCVGTTDHNFAVPYTNGATYQWVVQGNPNIATITSGNGTEHIKLDLNNTGVFQLLVAESDINGCTGYDSIIVAVHALPMPNIFAVGPTSFCEGDSVLLQVDSVYTIMQWDNGTTTVNNTVFGSGNHYVVVTDSNGCSNSSAFITTEMHPNPIADFAVDGICEDMPTVFTDLSTIVSDNISNSIWYFGDGTNDNGTSVQHYYANKGTYVPQLIVVSDFGCMDSLSKIISIYEQPTAAFTYNPATISTLQPDMNFTNTTLNAVPILWDFDDATFSTLEHPIHTFEDPGTYDIWLTVVDSNQCIDSVRHTITMYYDFILYVPNSFTPDKDGMNEQFGPKGVRMEHYHSYKFTVFNRWGEQVFTTDNINEQWDGSGAQEGAYSWMIIITDELGAIHKKIGEVTLIK